jgi:6,7-dimethyl-8-ribityllumazine synthase
LVICKVAENFDIRNTFQNYKLQITNYKSMIRSVHKLIVPKRAEDYDALVEFLTSLGLRRAEGWDGERSRGVKLQAPAAGVEVGFGRGFPDADVVIETDNVDAVYELIRQRGDRITTDIADQEWGARLFTVEAPGGLRVAIFSYTPAPTWSNVLEGDLRGTGRRFAIVVARFNAFVTERLLAGAIDGLRRTGVEQDGIEAIRVPGSFEIPVAARQAALTGRFDAIICLGCLLRGETAHYDAIVNEVTRGIGQSAQETGVPHAFGVLTCDTLEQAIDRAGLKMGNKGFEAALSAVEMASVREKIGSSGDRAIGSSGH